MNFLKTTLALAALTASLSAQGQEPKQAHLPGLQVFQQQLQQLPESVRKHLHFGEDAGLTAQKTTGTVTRIAAIAEKVYSGAAYINQGDSTKIYWHFQQGANLIYGDVLKKQFTPTLSQPEGPYDTYVIPDSYDSISIHSTQLPGGNYSNTSGREIGTTYANHSQQSVTTQSYTPPTWNNEEKLLFAYNSSGKRNMVQVDSWVSNAWQTAEKKDWTYDNQNRITGVTTSQWDNSSNTVLPVTRSLYSYDVAGNFISHKKQYSNGTPLVNGDSISMIYNAANQRIAEYNFSWNGSSWDTASRSTIAYNGQSKIDSILMQNYAGGGQWSNFLLQDYVYDVAGALTDHLTKTWNGASYDNEFRMSYTFTGNNLTSFASSSWDDVNNLWQNDSRYMLNYNGAGLLDALYTETWNGTTYTVDTGDTKVVFYYETILSVKDVAGSKLNFSAYPNPAQTHLTVQCQEGITTMKMVDAKGSIVWSSTVPKDQKNMYIDVSALAAGTYYLMAEGSKGKGSKMVTVVR